MRRHSVACCLLLLASLAVAGAYRYVMLAEAAPDGVRVAPQPDQRLNLSTHRADYLLGEPVQLQLTFRNIGKETVNLTPFAHTPDHYFAPVWIAPEAQEFREFVPNEGTCPGFREGLWVLKPSDSLAFEYRVLAGPRSGFALAFPKPGEYRVFADYPMWGKDRRIASNVVKVRVKPPVAEDAKVWAQMNQPAMLRLLQMQAFAKGREDAAVAKMVKLLETYPNSGYAPSMRYTLGKVYFRQRWSLTEADRKRLGEVLGIREVASFEDKRLGARIKHTDFDPTSLSVDEINSKLARSVGQMLLEMREATGLTFDAPQELKSLLAPSIGLSVEECMRLLSDHFEACWERRGDSYLLSLFDPDAIKGAHEQRRVEEKASGSH